MIAPRRDPESTPSFERLAREHQVPADQAVQIARDVNWTEELEARLPR